MAVYSLNQYADRIILTLKQIPVGKYNSIWEALCNDGEVDNNNLNKSNIELLDTVLKDDLKKFKQEDIVNLWNCTIDGDVYACSYMSDPPEYEGDMILDIKNEVSELIMIDIQDFK